MDPGGGKPGRDQAGCLAAEPHRGAEVPAVTLRRRGGLVFVTKANFGAFNPSGANLYSAIRIAAGLALFSFIGVETAAIVAKRVSDPRRNVGRASLLGTGASAIVYLYAFIQARREHLSQIPAPTDLASAEAQS